MSKMYIDQFYILNLKNIRKFEGVIHGKHFMLVGPNGAGKTTIFQAILRLLAALPDDMKPEYWVTKGEDKGEMTITIKKDTGEEYLIQEKITSDKRSRIRLWQINGDFKEEITPAKGRLQQILGKIMDLTPLMTMNGKEQFDFLSKALSIDTTPYDEARDRMVKSHTHLKATKGVLERTVAEYAMSEADIEKYKKELDVDTELKKKTVITILQKQLDAQKELVLSLNKKLDRITEIAKQIEALEKEQEKLKEETKNIEQEKRNGMALVAKITKAEIENDAIDTKIKDMSEHNRMHVRAIFYQEKKKELDDTTAQMGTLTTDIEVLDQKFYKGLASLPFNEIHPQLELRYKVATNDKKAEIGLFLDGLPFHVRQLSYGIMIRCVIKLAARLNPDGLNFIYISDWDKLDTKGKEELLAFAEEQENVQLGIEKPNDHTEVAIEFIELK